MELLIAAIQAGEVIQPMLQLGEQHGRAQLGFRPDACHGKRSKIAKPIRTQWVLTLHSEAVLAGTTPLSQFGIKLMVKARDHRPVETLLNDFAARITHALAQVRVLSKASNGHSGGFSIDSHMLSDSNDIVLISE